MKKFFCILLFCTLRLAAFTQTTVVLHDTLYTWSIRDVNTNTGERVIVTIDASQLSQFAGMSLAGQVIDNNSNWGDALPVVANFRAYVKVDAPAAYTVVQDVQTPDIVLRLRKETASRYSLTALLPNQFKGVQVLFRYTEGLLGSLTMSSPANLSAPAGTLVVSQPVYQAVFTSNVGIGTGSPQEALSVNGNARSKKVKVQTSNWPDYVFDSTYALAPLEQLQAFVQANHHLPGMPPAAEVTAHGLDLGETNRVLTRQLEELTLHLLIVDSAQQQMRKAALARLERQYSRNRELEKQVDQLLQRVDSCVNRIPAPVQKKATHF